MNKHCCMNKFKFFISNLDVKCFELKHLLNNSQYLDPRHKTSTIQIHNNRFHNINIYLTYKIIMCHEKGNYKKIDNWELLSPILFERSSNFRICHYSIIIYSTWKTIAICSIGSA